MHSPTNNLTPECVVNGTECYDGWLQAIYYLFIILHLIYLGYRTQSTSASSFYFYTTRSFCTKATSYM